MQQDITYGITQGVYHYISINDLPFCVNKCKTTLFADDTTIYTVGRQINNI